MTFSFIYPNALWLLLLVPLTIGIALLGPRRPTLARFWWGLGLRSLLLTLIVLALAGIQLRLPIDQLTTVFILDVSDSISDDAQRRGEALIHEAIRTMPDGDQAAIVVYGKDALVERLASKEQALSDLTSAPVTSQTNIGGALQLAMALFPSEGAKRLVLLSDGQENVGKAVEQSELAAANQIEISYVSLAVTESENEVLVESLTAPSDVREGQGFDLTTAIHSTEQTNATLRIFGDDTLLFSDAIRLQVGTNRIQVPVDSMDGGFYRFRAQIVPEVDNRLQNNEATAFTFVHGPPRLLVIENQADEATQFVQALQSSDVNVVTIPPSNLPMNLDELAAYDGIALINTPVDVLPAGSMEMLQVYVSDLGKGLLMTGGEDSFGAGGYLRTPIEEMMPVDMDVRNTEQTPNIALALVVDKSGSMGGCHCDDPNKPSTAQTRVNSGQPKVDIAKEAIMQAAEALGPQDQLGVVAFDSAARWAINMAQLGDFSLLEQDIAGIQANGQTNLQAGVEAALYALEGAEARRKHMILLTDGWGQAGRVESLVDEMTESGITLSVVAAGAGSATELAQLASQGGGRFYPSADILSVPDFFLKETVTAVGRYLVEEPFYPLFLTSSPILRGIDPALLPTLWGYNGTSIKPIARTVLATPRGDPLLATWQYGLGRTAAWTSDVTSRWAVDWVEWEAYTTFVNQLASWMLAPPQVEGFAAQTKLEDGKALITVDATDISRDATTALDLTATLIGPDLEAKELALDQVGVGQYSVQTGVEQPGVYLVQLQLTDDEEPIGQQTLGLAVPYSPEYGVHTANRGLLTQLANRTGGSELLEPTAAFLHNLPTTEQVREIWQWLLLATTLLFPLDIAIRRVLFQNVSPRRMGTALQERTADSRIAKWLQRRLPQRVDGDESGEKLLGSLHEARKRPQPRRRPQEDVDSAGVDLGGSPQRAEQSRSSINQTDEAKPQRETHNQQGQDTLSRLQQAKRRARK